MAASAPRRWPSRRKSAARGEELRVADNQVVHKGDVLFVVDPRNYKNRRGSGQGQCSTARRTTSASPDSRRKAAPSSAISPYPRKSAEQYDVSARVAFGGGRAGARKTRYGESQSGARERSARRSNGYVDQPAAAARRLCQGGPGGPRHRRQRFLLGRRLFRGDAARRDPSRRQGAVRPDGLSRSRADTAMWTASAGA